VRIARHRKTFPFSRSTQDSAGLIRRQVSRRNSGLRFPIPLLLEDLAIRFPKLKIVIMHMGWPFYDHALYMLWTYENVYLNTATVNWLVGKELLNRMLREAVDTVGSHRILFGSDQMVWSQMITPAIGSIRDAPFLSDQDKRNILSENARRLLKTTN
jgi:uncharacterized protein